MTEIEVRKKHQTSVLTAFALAGSLIFQINAQQENNMNSKELIHIGWASRDITPKGKVNLSGQFYPRITDKVRDPLSVTALTVSNRNDAFIFVSCDVVQNAALVIDKARAGIKNKNPDFPIDKLVINVTHTHTAPDIRGAVDYATLDQEDRKGLQSPEDNLNLLVNGIVEAALESWEARKPGMFAWGFGNAEVGRNRRMVYLKDFQVEHQGDPGKVIEKNARLYGNTNVPDFSHIEGYEDHNVNFIFTFDMNKKLTGSIINIACPSQESEQLYMASADFWHEVRLLLRGKYGNDLFILPQCAAAGDQISRPMRNRRAEERMRDLKNMDSRQIIAQKIGAAFDDAFSWAPRDIRAEAPIVHSTREIQLSRRMPSEEEYSKNLKWIKEYEAMPMLDPREKRFLSRCKNTVKRYEDMKNGIDLYQTMELHAIRLGDIAFATNSFELFLDYGIRIQERSPAIQTFIVQLAGKGVEFGGSYLPSRRAELGGGYSASVYCNQVGSKGGQELVDASIAELDKLWADSRKTYQIPRANTKSCLRLEMNATGLNSKTTNHGQASMCWDNEALRLNVEVSDPSHFNPHAGSRIWEGDSLQLAIIPDKDDGFFNIVTALTKKGVEAYQYDKKNRLLEQSRISISRDEDRRITSYEVIIPLKLLGINPISGSKFRLNAAVHNDDRHNCKWIEICHGLAGGYPDVRLFPEFVLSN